jgi:hypothetical protein
MKREKYSEQRYILALIQSESPVVEQMDSEVIEQAKKEAA